MPVAVRSRQTDPAKRAESVVDAAEGLVALVTHAAVQLVAHGATDERTLAAWEAVERRGAIIHRQSRLLAGKSKGG
jgi:C4-type Zn-finger protein